MLKRLIAAINFRKNFFYFQRKIKNLWDRKWWRKSLKNSFISLFNNFYAMLYVATMENSNFSKCQKSLWPTNRAIILATRSIKKICFDAAQLFHQQPQLISLLRTHLFNSYCLPPCRFQCTRVVLLCLLLIFLHNFSSIHLCTPSAASITVNKT